MEVVGDALVTGIALGRDGCDERKEDDSAVPYTPDSGYSTNGDTKEWSSLVKNIKEEMVPEPEPPDSGYSSTKSGDSCESSPAEKRTVKVHKTVHKSDKPDLIPELKHLKINNQEVSQEVIQKARHIVERAVKQHKVFVVSGHYNSIKKALRRRGWLEKPCCRCSNCRSKKPIGNCKQMCDFDFWGETRESSFNVKDWGKNNDIESIVNKLLQGVAPNFLWCTQRNKIQWKRLRKDQIVNRFPHAHFTTKIGIDQSLQSLHWFTNFSTHTFFPRCYQVFIDEERRAFIDDYRLTACLNVLKWFVAMFTEYGTQGVEAATGRVRRTVVEFSIARCDEYRRYKENLDIDTPIQAVWEHQWEQFITEYYTLILEGAKLQQFYQGSRSTEDLFKSSKETLSQMRLHCPQIHIDGVMNLWIIKPACSSRGRGIVINNRLEKILALLGGTAGQRRYVFQKYIERPLLIHNTKFDIRQWVLVTDWNPLVIWLYKSSYLRFSSQSFKLEDFHESVHLTNAAIQVKYKNGDRSPFLPEENMWDNDMFISYLRQNGHPNAWNKIIYPGIKKALIGSLLATQDSMEACCVKKNCFELYGADFMLSSDMNPWLIEINSSPALGASTTITSRLCSAVLEDVIKVTVDRTKNKNADTGGFELVYKQPYVQQPQYVGISLAIQGSRVALNSRTDRTAEELEYARSGYKVRVGSANSSHSGGKTRLVPSSDNLHALFAEAELLASRGVPNMADLIDTIMSIPSCLQDQQSKLQVVNKWIKENKSEEVKNGAEVVVEEPGEKTDPDLLIKLDQSLAPGKGKGELGKGKAQVSAKVEENVDLIDVPGNGSIEAETSSDGIVGKGLEHKARESLSNIKQNSLDQKKIKVLPKYTARKKRGSFLDGNYFSLDSGKIKQTTNCDNRTRGSKRKSPKRAKEKKVSKLFKQKPIKLDHHIVPDANIADENIEESEKHSDEMGTSEREKKMTATATEIPSSTTESCAPEAKEAGVIQTINLLDGIPICKSVSCLHRYGCVHRFQIRKK